LFAQHHSFPRRRAIARVAKLIAEAGAPRKGALAWCAAG